MDSPSLLDVLELEQIEQDIYRANLVVDEDRSLYGGQVAAQALLAAGLTVAPGRPPHSLHGYFLRAGDPAIPTVFQVFRDRDGGSFSARRAVAIQRGEVILNMSASFHRPDQSPAAQSELMPGAGPPGTGRPYTFPRLFSIEAMLPSQPFEGLPWPTRFWARSTAPLPSGELIHACALTYLSDISTGVLPSADGQTWPGASLDHSVWFHHPVDMNGWTLSDYHPQRAGGGRGWYTGSMFTPDGTLVASIAQETLFRGARPFSAARSPGSGTARSAVPMRAPVCPSVPPSA